MPNWWQSWMTPAIVLALTAWLWVALRPALVRLLYHLLCTDEERFEKTLFGTLESKSGRVRFRAYSLEVHAERVKTVDGRIDEALNVANANKDSLVAVRQVQDLHGSALKEVTAAVKDLPQMSDALVRISKSLEAFTRELKDVNETMIRLEERSGLDDRRQKQTPGSPKRRAED
jgi:hypothetical protein